MSKGSINIFFNISNNILSFSLFLVNFFLFLRHTDGPNLANCTIYVHICTYVYTQDISDAIKYRYILV